MMVRLARINWVSLFQVGMLVGVLASLVMALGIQVLWGELPCPLCMLQRIGITSVAIGILLNLRFGSRPSHYSLIFISCLLTAAISLRQIAMHVVPGSGAYGSPFLGYHLYTWAFMAAFVLMFVNSVVMAFDGRAQRPAFAKQWTIIFSIFIAMFLAVQIANTLTAAQICGFTQCPGDPIAVFHSRDHGLS
tara:strand:- start:197 stop:769 length:573 start_codon:yes stop_codon:yes gene_type:complete